MRTAVLTLAAGRHRHLRTQGRALARLAEPPDAYYVVAMGDNGVRAAAQPPARVLEVPAPDGALPLAEARNHGADRALADGADLLVFLDADCVPGPGLLEHYRAAVRRRPHGLLCGPVTYLPPPPPGGYDLDALVEDPHPARPAPPAGTLEKGEDYTLFWSLSFAVSAATWTRLGGFSTAYRGYGAEDTDFGQQARAAGVELWWVGGATAFHQHHPPSASPARAAEMVANANAFHERWGWWPMEGWLTELAEAGVAAIDPATGRWALRPGTADVAGHR